MTPVKSEVVNAPFVKELPVVLECEVLKVVEIGLHTQFIGEIKDIKADENILAEKGLPDIKKLQPFIYTTIAPVRIIMRWAACWGRHIRSGARNNTTCLYRKHKWTGISQPLDTRLGGYDGRVAALIFLNPMAAKILSEIFILPHN